MPCISNSKAWAKHDTSSGVSVCLPCRLACHFLSSELLVWRRSSLQAIWGIQIQCTVAVQTLTLNPKP